MNGGCAAAADRMGSSGLRRSRRRARGLARFAPLIRASVTEGNREKRAKGKRPGASFARTALMADHGVGEAIAAGAGTSAATTSWRRNAMLIHRQLIGAALFTSLLGASSARADAVSAGLEKEPRHSLEVSP